jgi:ribosomal silencing factor RsfS
MNVKKEENLCDTCIKCSLSAKLDINNITDAIISECSNYENKKLKEKINEKNNNNN